MVAFLLTGTAIDEFEATKYEETPYVEPATLSSTPYATSATIAWTAESTEETLTAWNLEYKKASDESWSETQVYAANTLTADLTNLSDNTEYEVRVRAVYGDNLSRWKQISFTTLLAPISSFPWTEDFTGLTSTIGIPAGWNNDEGTTTNASYKWTYYNSGNTSAPCVRFNSYNNSNGITNFLKTPVMNFTEGTGMKLSFWYKNPKGGDFSVYISNDGGATYTTELATGLTGASDWTEKVVNIPSEFVDNVVIVFKGTSNWGSGDAYIYLDDVTVKEATNNPATMEISYDSEAIDGTFSFGSVNKANTKTFTVANDGDQTLNVTEIAVSGTDASCFAVSPATLEVKGGQTGTFNVTFTPTDEEDVEKTATITLTAGELTKSFTVTGTYVNLWTEDFEGGVLPTNWEATTWTIGTFSDYENKTNMALAPSNSTAGTIITPRLEAKSGDVLTWDAYLNWYDEALIVEYSNDNKATWTQIYNYKTQNDSEAPSTTQRYYHKAMSFTAPADGEYFLRFTSTYQNGVDNFSGFKLAAAKEHEAEILSSTIPATGNQYVEYTATVNVKELAGKEETVAAELYIGENKVAEVAETTLAANSEQTITLTFTPEEAMSGNAYIKVYNENIELTTEPTAVEIAAATVFDENAENTFTKDQVLASVVVKYTAKQGWNTITLPFNVTDFSVFGEGVEVYELGSYANGQLQFNPTTTMYGGYGYVMYIGTLSENNGAYKFQNVTINKSAAEEETKGNCTVKPTYAPIAEGGLAATETYTNYGIANGKVVKCGAKTTLRALRMYLQVTGTSAKELGSNLGGEATAIDAAELLNNQTGDIYDLSGRKVLNAQKGIYIQNGKKYVVK
ncbi:MAG: fibronectin type III domain-containing protein [Bacteroidaceae bacterium]|nr:fibronectin type III domain-containing protein [Bacteroidaceae bacterium]